MAWVLSIAFKVARRHRALKRTQNEQPGKQPSPSLTVASGDPSPEELVDGRFRYHELVKDLPDDRRAVFALGEGEEGDRIAHGVAG